MKISKFVMAFGLTLIMGSAMATGKVDRECSPGFYHNQNGQMYWYDQCTTGMTVAGVPISCETALESLTAGRPYTRNIWPGVPPGVVHNLVADQIVRQFLGGSDSTKDGPICAD